MIMLSSPFFVFKYWGCRNADIRNIDFRFGIDDIISNSVSFWKMYVSHFLKHSIV